MKRVVFTSGLRHSHDGPRSTTVLARTARRRLVGKQLVGAGKVQWCATHVTSLTLYTETLSKTNF